MTTERQQLFAEVMNEELRLRECYADAMEAGNEEQAKHFQVLSHFMTVYVSHLATGDEAKLEGELMQLSMQRIPYSTAVAIKMHEAQKAGLVSAERMKAIMTRLMKFTSKAFEALLRGERP